MNEIRERGREIEIWLTSLTLARGGGVEGVRGSDQTGNRVRQVRLTNAECFYLTRVSPPNYITS